MFGGLVTSPDGQKRPMICGGFALGGISKDCFSLEKNNWVKSAELTRKTADINAVTSPFGDEGIITVGGTVATLSSLDVVQHYSNQAWKTVPPTFPHDISAHCLLNLDDTTLVVTGGFHSNYLTSNESYMLNVSSKSGWTKGS